jgi:hypothetical protein
MCKSGVFGHILTAEQQLLPHALRALAIAHRPPDSISIGTSTLSLVEKALERAGIEFLDDGRPGVRLRSSTK